LFGIDIKSLICAPVCGEVGAGERRASRRPAHFPSTSSRCGTRQRPFSCAPSNTAQARFTPPRPHADAIFFLSVARCPGSPDGRDETILAQSPAFISMCAHPTCARRHHNPPLLASSTLTQSFAPLTQYSLHATARQPGLAASPLANCYALSAIAAVRSGPIPRLSHDDVPRAGVATIRITCPR